MKPGGKNIGVGGLSGILPRKMSYHEPRSSPAVPFIVSVILKHLKRNRIEAWENF